MAGLVYDTGALLAAERRDPRLWSLHARALARDVQPAVPVVVLAQAWRGGPQPNLSRVLRGCSILHDDEAMGRAAGRACALAGLSVVVDALVVVTALARGAVVATSDPHDLTQLAAGLGADLPLLVI